jgi:hypothetical protein
VDEEEVDGALGDAVSPCLLAFALGKPEELVEGDLGEDMGAIGDYELEDVEEVLLGVGDEEFVDHDFGWGFGGGGGAVAEEVGEEA